MEKNVGFHKWGNSQVERLLNSPVGYVRGTHHPFEKQMGNRRVAHPSLPPPKVRVCQARKHCLFVSQTYNTQSQPNPLRWQFTEKAPFSATVKPKQCREYGCRKPCKLRGTKQSQCGFMQRFLMILGWLWHGGWLTQVYGLCRRMHCSAKGRCSLRENILNVKTVQNRSMSMFLL